MNTTDTIVIGEGFYGLFVAIKIAEKGYNVKIFEKNTKPLFIQNIRLLFP
jgi:predicted flavoprotein YhiN